MEYIPYAKQTISQSDIEAITKVLKSDFLTQGPIVEEFEKSIKNKVGAKFATSVNSATSALHIACKALGLNNNDWVWTSPNTFVASANCAIYCGAKVDFIDIDSKTYNISIKKLKEKLVEAKKNNNLPKIIIPVHYAGQSCCMKELSILSKEYDFKIIEDGSHALGGKYLNKFVGCCEYSDITVFSFHPVKIITTGEGGAAVTNSSIIDQRMKLYKSHGITREKEKLIENTDKEIWNYAQETLGFNYRIPDINCALGINQMNRLDEFISKRHKIANRYDVAFKDSIIQIPSQNKDTFSSYHLYPIRIKENKYPKGRNFVFQELKKKNIGVNIHYIPVYRHPYFSNMGFKKGYCKEAEKFFQEVISLPIFPNLKLYEQNYIIKNILDILALN